MGMYLILRKSCFSKIFAVKIHPRLMKANKGQKRPKKAKKGQNSKLIDFMNRQYKMVNKWECT